MAVSGLLEEPASGPYAFSMKTIIDYFGIRGIRLVSF
jgi:hypothetical protein